MAKKLTKDTAAEPAGPFAGLNDPDVIMRTAAAERLDCEKNIDAIQTMARADMEPFKQRLKAAKAEIKKIMPLKDFDGAYEDWITDDVTKVTESVGNKRRAYRALGVLKQGDLFHDGPATEAPLSGYEVGKAGRPIELNPYIKGSDGHDAWEKDWLAGTAANLAGGPKGDGTPAHA